MTRVCGRRRRRVGGCGAWLTRFRWSRFGWICFRGLCGRCQAYQVRIMRRLLMSKFPCVTVMWTVCRQFPRPARYLPDFSPSNHWHSVEVLAKTFLPLCVWADSLAAQGVKDQRILIGICGPVGRRSDVAKYLTASLNCLKYVLSSASSFCLGVLLVYGPGSRAANV